MAHYLTGFVILLASWLAHPAMADDALRDPTQPPPSLNAPTNDNNVVSTGSPIQMIVMHGDQGTAIVRGIPVKVGDHISEGLIVAITEHGVMVRSDHSRSTVELFPTVNKYLHDDTHHDPFTIHKQR